MAEGSIHPDAVFNAARRLTDPAARRAYLDRACAAAPGMREKVDALLAAYDDAGSFLESPAADFGAGATLDQPARPPREGPGSLIGPYKLLQQIGEGGMGVVFLAEQTRPVRRQVALKVIKAGMDTRQVVARFESERQALALMDHPNIAKVLDAGATETGQPYFVMELVKGVPITRYCDEHRLTPRDRLSLFVQVCQAVQHAHTKGVIHRDIKPTNVLVALYDGRPVPKVIDFGVAKATGGRLTEQTVFTGFGSVVGTPEYMSPEQAELNQLDIDTRSDVYSLGVILYELLTGSTPLERKRLNAAALLEVLRVVREQDPPKPSTRLGTTDQLASIAASRGLEPKKLSGVVRGELDWIVMRALEKDRARRYETANNFAADVQRYLSDEAVHACPPSVGYRSRKFVRRNKASLAVTGLVLLIVLTATAGIGWNVRNRAARRTAVDQEAGLALKEADQLQEQARWPEALSAAKRAQGLLAGGGSDELRERSNLLQRDLEMVLRLDEIPLLSSQWKDDKFDYEAADRAFAQAFADYGIDVERLSVDEAAARIRARARVTVALATALDEWAFSRSKTDPAGGVALRAVAQAADPDSWRRRVRQADQQKDTKALTELAASQGVLRQPPVSLRVLARALKAGGPAGAETELLRRAQRQYPGDFWINFTLAKTFESTSASTEEDVAFYRAALAARPLSTAACNNLANALQMKNRFDEAIACYRRLGELDPKFTRHFGSLGLTLYNQGQLDEAIVCLRMAIKLAPNDRHNHLHLGLALSRQGKLDEAIVAYLKAIEIDPKYASAYTSLAGDLGRQKKLPEAIAACQTAIKLDPNQPIAYNNLANALAEQKKLPAAIAAFNTSIELDPKQVLAYDNLAITLDEAGRPEEAIATCRRGIDFTPQNAKLHYRLGDLLSGQKQWTAAIAEYRKAIDLDPAYAPAHWGLAEAFLDQGNVDGAIASARTAAALKPGNADARENLADTLNCAAFKLATDPGPKPSHPGRALELVTEAARLKPNAYWGTQGAVHYRAGHWKDAIAALEESIKSGDGYCSDWLFLSMALWQAGDKVRARKRYDQAVGWMEENAPDTLLRRLRAEAKDLLKIAETQPTTKAASKQ